eukprot:m.22155 g.22155  ORF g.22155 m.22155 type:complete len:60 (+) comp7356_c0_seq2:142-321(+)
MLATVMIFKRSEWKEIWTAPLESKITFETSQIALKSSIHQFSSLQGKSKCNKIQQSLLL